MDEWQPIETAPKDGTPVLLSCDGDVTVGWKSPHGDIWIDAVDEDGFTFNKPTHWMPLPDPPKVTP